MQIQLVSSRRPLADISTPVPTGHLAGVAVSGSQLLSVPLSSIYRTKPRKECKNNPSCTVLCQVLYKASLPSPSAASESKSLQGAVCHAPPISWSHLKL